jgi:hypothetical protein
MQNDIRADFKMKKQTFINVLGSAVVNGNVRPTVIIDVDETNCLFQEQRKQGLSKGRKDKIDWSRT